MTASTNPAPRVRTTRRTRLAAIGATTATSLAAWLLIAPISGRDLKVKQGTDTATVGPVDVVVVSLLAGLAGWGLLAFLERRHTERPLHVSAVTARCVLAFVARAARLGNRIGQARTGPRCTCLPAGC